MNAKKVASFAVGPIGGAALGFITLPIIAWFYSVEDIGRIAMLQVFSSLFILLFSLGLDQAYVREYHETEQKQALLKAALLPGLLLLSMALALCLLESNFISNVFFSVKSALVSILVALCLFAAFVSRFLSLILRMQERGLAFSMSQILPKIIFLSVIGFYVTFSVGFDFLHLLLAHTLSSITVTVVYSWNTRAEWLSAFKQSIDTDKLKSMFRFGTPLIMGGVAFWGLTAMDKVFLRSFSSYEELGIYSVASSFAAVAIIFQSVFSTVWAPTVYKWAAEGIDPNLIDQVAEHVLAVVVFVFVLVGMLSWLITYLLPETYKNVQYILMSCMAYPLFYTLSEVTVVGLSISRKSTYAMLAAIIAALTNLISNYILVPAYGAAGAAVSTSIAFWVFFFCRTEFSSLVWRRMPRMKLYSMTLICLLTSIAFTLVGKNFHLMFIGVWGGIMIFAFCVFSFSISCAIDQIKKLMH